jgi:hypothetical protein
MSERKTDRISYGGHYGPGFYNYFYQQNEAIKNGTVKGVELHMDTLGIINGSKCEQSYIVIHVLSLTAQSLMSRSKHHTTLSSPSTTPTVSKPSTTQSTIS